MDKDNLQKFPKDYTTYQAWAAILAFPLMALGPIGFILIIVLWIHSGLWGELVKYYTNLLS